MKDLPKGIVRLPSGSWRVFVRVRGQLHTRTFPAETRLSAVVDGRERLKAELKYGAPTSEEHAPTFRDDAREYLALVRHMPSYADREYRINCWVEVFGSRLRSTITAREIRAQLERWRAHGHANGGPLSPGSLNQRRTALMAMYTTLDGKSAANIVRDVPAYDERYSEKVRAESMLTCVRLIRRLRVRGKMRAVLYALLWTGLPHKLFSGLKPDDIDWTAGRIRVGRRKKGKGMAPAWVPVVPRALIALRRVQARNAWGGCSTSSLHSALARAVVSENRWRAAKNAAAGRQIWPMVAEDFSPYGLRHSFATWAAARIKDDRALKELLRTNSITRYTEGAIADRLEAARDLLITDKPKRAPGRVLPFAARGT